MPIIDKSEGPEHELMKAILREIDNSEVDSVLMMTQILANVMAYIVKDIPFENIADYLVMLADVTYIRLHSVGILQEYDGRPN